MKLIDIINAIINKVAMTIYEFKYVGDSKLLDLWVNNVKLESIIKINENIINITFRKLKKFNLFICLFIINLRLNTEV